MFKNHPGEKWMLFLTRNSFIVSVNVEDSKLMQGSNHITNLNFLHYKGKSLKIIIISSSLIPKMDGILMATVLIRLPSSELSRKTVPAISGKVQAILIETVVTVITILSCFNLVNQVIVGCTPGPTWAPGKWEIPI